MDEDKGRLDTLKQSLYRRGQGEKKPRAWSRFTKKRSDVRQDWEHDHPRTSGVVGVRQPRRAPRGLSVRFFIFSVIFFLIALGVATFIIIRGTNEISPDNIDLAVSGPVSIAGGESLDLQIDIANRNNTTLQSVDLLVEFPEGTRNPEAPGELLRRSRETLGELAPGEGASRNISALLFGEEGGQKEVVVGIEYRIADSNAIFFKESVFEVQIGTAPVSILINMPTETNSGKEISVVAELISNTTETLEDVALSIEYPFGFSFEEGQPAPDIGEGIWLLGDLAPEERRTVTVKGTIEGQDSEERTFRFVGGLSDGVDIRAIDTVLLETQRSLAISRPFLEADLVLGGSPGETYVAEPGGVVAGVLSWRNNLSVPVENAQINVVLEGAILDETSVSTFDGFYRSLDNTIIWDKTRVPSLALLEPGARGQVSFEFRSVDPLSSAFQGGVIDLSVYLSGDRTGSTAGATGRISSSLEKRWWSRRV